MAHDLIGKLCQYKSEHRDKVLFTYNLSEKDLAEVRYSIHIWDDEKAITGNTAIPSWYYVRFMGRKGNKGCPDPYTFNTPYACLPNTLSNIFTPGADKVHHFLVIDSKMFINKIGKIEAGKRIMLKTLFVSDDNAQTYWLDEKWVEPYAHAETYMDDLKARMLNKLRQNT